MNIPRLVGHRGYPRHYPENTVCGLEATPSGCCFVEVDVQLTMDLVPVVVHDASLKRTGGVAVDVLDTNYEDLRETVVDERRRLGKANPRARLPALSDVVAWLGRRPVVEAFIEVKAESAIRFGHRAVIDRVLQDLEPVAGRVTVISFDAEVLRIARRVGGCPVGWVLPGWGENALAEAGRLAPEFLFCDYTRIPGTVLKLPQGNWQWVLYDITDPRLALEWADRGAALIETAAIGEMLAHPLLSRRACGG